MAVWSLTTHPTTKTEMLGLVSIAVTIFSLAWGLLALFVLPSRCSFLSSLQLVLAAAGFIFGLIGFLVWKVLEHRARKLT